MHPTHSPIMLALFASQLDAQRARCRTENQWNADPDGMAAARHACDTDALGMMQADLDAAEIYYATN